MRCASHGADRIRPSAIRPTEAEAFLGEDDRSNDRDGLVTEGEPQAGESIRVGRESGGGRYEKKDPPRGGGEPLTLGRGAPPQPHEARKREARQVRLEPLPSPPPSPLQLHPTHW